MVIASPNPEMAARWQKHRSRRYMIRHWVRSASTINEYFFAGLLILASTAVAWLIEPFTGYQTVALLYLLLVVLVGLKLSRGPVLTVAASSAALWNFLFVPPYFTLHVQRFHDGIMFVVFFVVALAMGHLTSRLRWSEIVERQRERRTAALYELAQQAAFATDLDTGLRAAVNLIDSIFTAKAALFVRQKDHSLSSGPHAVSSFDLSELDNSVVAWVFSHRVPAGKFTGSFPDAEALHLPLQGRTAVMGVLSVRSPAGKPFDRAERDLLEAFAVLIGLVLEKNHIVEAFKRAEILEASEHLRHALLQSVSHELKTPLSAVQAGIDAITRQTDRDEKKQRTLREVQVAVRRLHRVINNLLDMTRIESGVIQPKLDWCDVEELIQAAIDLAGESLNGHQITLDLDSRLPMIKIDQPLLEQCLCNLMLNSAANSPPGTKITIGAQLSEGQLIISVMDEGKGIRHDDRLRIFDAFYRGGDAAPGGTGLGLAIVDGFVRAHGGSVRALNRERGGAEFVISIPVEILRPEIMESLE
jgi:two-component system, OmpR family, sensor histidine kinase KdpD